jgi:predicted dehydrogenase
MNRPVVKWVVVGIGDLTTKRVIPAIHSEQRSQLYGLVTRDPNKAKTYSAKVWTSLEEAVADPEVDAVYVASPVFLHHDQTVMALRAGKHVLCEKPMSLNYSQSQHMQQVADEMGRLLGVAYYRRLYPKVRRTQELLAEGVVGPPLTAELTNHYWFSGDRDEREWKLDPAKAGGGPLYDIACHRIDVLNFWFGKPLRVAAQMGNAIHKMAVEDNATVLIEYEHGVRGIVDVRWNSRVARDECRIRGVDGEINLTPLNSPLLIAAGLREDLPSHLNLHYPCVENFVSAVLGQAPLVSSGKTGMLTDWVIEQAVASASRQPVSV